METLFGDVEKQQKERVAPLAVRMRPQTLDEYVGQKQAVGEGSWLRTAIENDALSSIILYGPAGTGKTTLAHIIASTTDAAFVEVSAVTGTVKDLRNAIQDAENRLMVQERKTILFIDEIHRFSRSQQDALLHAVENRIVIMIGATTENPYFEVNSALNSRARIIELTALDRDDINQILEHALTSTRGLRGNFKLKDDAQNRIADISGGDARSALTTLELASEVVMNNQNVDLDDLDTMEDSLVISLDDIEKASVGRSFAYDKTGDEHYDTISAFIKSMRGSDPDAVVYWLAKMIEGGEDPQFIARRILIFASEDIGNADPQALLVAASAFYATSVIGYPECAINLSQAVVYMALAPKSNASYLAIKRAQREVKKGPRREIPSALRDRHRPGSDEYGEYLYPHDAPAGFVHQQYLPDGLSKGDFFVPGERGWEAYRISQTYRDRFEQEDQEK